MGAPEIRDLRGSLLTNIEKGIFITTGRFTQQAKDEASAPGKQKIDLIDGDDFMEKLAQYGIGVNEVKTYEVDEQFFAKFEQNEPEFYCETKLVPLNLDIGANKGLQIHEIVLTSQAGLGLGPISGFDRI